MHRLSIFAISIFSICTSISFAQNPQWSQEINVIPPSPNVTSFQKYIDSPISLYTGTPDVSIPIYTQNTPQLTLPISLTYNASGLKVEERASWIGEGFSLNVGGAVSRSTTGMPDDYNVAGGSRKGWLFNSNATAVKSLTSSSDDNLSICTDELTDWNSLVGSGHVNDTELDVFFVSIPSKSV